MPDRLTGMQVFQKVAALGSFSAAARTLGMSQTMVTKHVAALERHLGARLFQRTTRRLTLTEAGTRYRASAERILAEIDEAEREVSATSTELTGTLRLNLPLAFGIREVVPALTDFAALYPALTIDIGLSDRLVDLVEEDWDLAIRIGRLSDSSLVARKLAPIRTMLCAAPAYLARHGAPRTAADLRDHNCLGYTLPTPASAERWTFGREGDVVVPVAGTFRANNGDALREAAVAGIGIIYQPLF
ncbi:MAG: LysR family transcriptional regulator, partial [Rhizobiales bacterium]|nr:LysR family transcriptional regulator [Hyphomicrobiales bacterium]